MKKIILILVFIFISFSVFATSTTNKGLKNSTNNTSLEIEQSDFVNERSFK